MAKKTDSTRYALPALRFKTCRLLSGNVRNRELTIIQRRILRRLRNKMRSIKRKIYPRENLNSYILCHKKRQLVFLEIVGDYIIPALISFFALYVLGLPIVCFCESGDGDWEDDQTKQPALVPKKRVRPLAPPGPLRGHKIRT